MNQYILKLWNEFKELPYPLAAHMKERDFELHDSLAAGCIGAYLNTGKLETEKGRTLKNSLEYLEAHLQELPPEARGYFDKLKQMGELVLTESAQTEV